MTKIDRRKFLLNASSLLGVSSFMMPSITWAAPDDPKPSSKRFLLNIHFGSGCGIANGLVQPVKKGDWPTGFFRRGSNENAQNPLLNSHTGAGNLIFTDYNKFMADMSEHMCLMNGTPQVLDHGSARNLQTAGSKIKGVSPEWVMAVAQNMKMQGYSNPLAITDGFKSKSVSDASLMLAGSFAQFKTITSDSSSVAKGGQFDSIWKVLKDSYKEASLDTTDMSENLSSDAVFQIETLVKGMPALKELENDGSFRNLENKLSKNSIAKVLEQTQDKQAILDNWNPKVKDQLVLAGLLAKSGLASGMTIKAAGEDRHGGGADVETARNASATWAKIYQLWSWIKEEGMQNDVAIVVTQEFARSPYNSNYMDIPILTKDGRQTVRCFGRDHGLFMGKMVINANVAPASRVGRIGENLTPQAAMDLSGRPDTSLAGHVSVDLMGSMLMRIFPELFPSERMVRKHWPNFKEVAALLK